MSEPSTNCCIVGGGPAGAMLALLLARKGVPVTLLEAHKDFDRAFRGDTLHPSSMEILDSLGLADRLLEMPHTKVPRLTLQTPAGDFAPADLSRLRTRFNYITLIPQPLVLQLLVDEAKKYPHFRLIMGARFDELALDGRTVRGVHYTQGGVRHELPATLTVGCDGRSSRVRTASGLDATLQRSSPPMDILWFRLPRRSDDRLTFSGSIRDGHMLVTLPREDHFQLGYVILKGGYHALREAGMDRFRGTVAELRPELADRVGLLHDWHDVTLLSVASSCLTKWHRPGLLLIGDAAHVMSPVGGIGINSALQDAVVAANVIASPMLRGKLDDHHLEAVQRQRIWPTRVLQWFQARVQEMIIRQALNPTRPFRLPWMMRLPFLRDLPAWVFGYGLTRTRVK